MNRKIALALSVVIPGGVWVTTPLWAPSLASASGRDFIAAGQLGGTFETISALFSGLALIGVTYGPYLQVQLRRRERQPEIFARLAARASEKPLVLAPMGGTPQGEALLTLAVPVYIVTGENSVAYNATISVEYEGLARESFLRCLSRC